jgi:hypothetical protein
LPSRFAARRQTYAVRDPSPPLPRTADAKRPSQQRSKKAQDARSALFHPPPHNGPPETDPQTCRDALLDPAPRRPSPKRPSRERSPMSNPSRRPASRLPILRLNTPLRASRNSNHANHRAKSTTLRSDVTPQPHVQPPAHAPSPGSPNVSAPQRPTAHKTHAQQTKPTLPPLK